MARAQLLLLDPRDNLTQAEPKRLRYCLLHVAGTIVHSSRRRWLRLADTWPWTPQLLEAFRRLDTIPLRI